MKLYIIAGRPCSGKTTIAYKLGLKSGLKVLYLDVFAHEMVAASNESTLELYKWKKNSLYDILNDNPLNLLNDYIKSYKELFPLLLNELKHKYNEDLILESSIFLPEFVLELSREFDIYVQYIKTTDEYVNERYVERDYVKELLKKSNGKNVVNNLLERDKLFAKLLYEQAESACYPIFNIESDKDYDILLKKLYIDFAF